MNSAVSAEFEHTLPTEGINLSDSGAIGDDERMVVPPMQTREELSPQLQLSPIR